MKLKMLISLQVFLLILAPVILKSQTCTNFAANYDGIHLNLSGLNNGGKVRVSITHNGGVSYTDVTPKLTAGQDVAVVIPREPVESVLMEALDISMNSICSKSFIVTPTKTKPSVPTVDIMSERGISTLIVDKGTLQMKACVMPATLSDRSVTWSLVYGTGKASIDANGLVTACSNGTVTVTATSKYNSSVSSSMVLNFLVQNTPCTLSYVESLSETFSIHPNPVFDLLHINGTNFIKAISIFNSEGFFIKSVKVENISAEIDVNELSSGLYLLKVDCDNGVGVKKFIKQ